MHADDNRRGSGATPIVNEVKGLNRVVYVVVGVRGRAAE